MSRKMKMTEGRKVESLSNRKGGKKITELKRMKQDHHRPRKPCSEKVIKMESKQVIIGY